MPAPEQAIQIEKHESGEGYLLTSSILVEESIDKVFDFFADAGNLEAITPEFLNFKVISDLPIEMGVDALIDYKLQLYGVPFKWRTRIAAWDPPVRFVDQQLRGPYRQWHHEHVFHALDGGGTRCEDFVHYKVPFGNLVNKLFVERNVRNIFEFRQTKLRQVFACSEQAMERDQ